MNETGIINANKTMLQARLFLFFSYWETHIGATLLISTGNIHISCADLITSTVTRLIKMGFFPGDCLEKG